VNVTEDYLIEDTTAEVSSTKSVLKAGISKHIRDKLANTDTRTFAQLLADETPATPSCYQSEIVSDWIILIGVLEN
jgi:hypothetical protein